MKHLTAVFFFCLLTYACEEIIEVEDISQDDVVVLAPTNNSILNANTITFSWEALDFSDSYRLQIARPGFSDAVQIEVDTLINSTSFNVSLLAGSYQWRIKAINSAYETAYKTQSFTIED